MKWILLLLALTCCGCKTTMSFLLDPNTAVSVSLDDNENIQVSVNHFHNKCRR